MDFKRYERVNVWLIWAHRWFHVCVPTSAIIIRYYQNERMSSTKLIPFTFYTKLNTIEHSVFSIQYAYYATSQSTHFSDVDFRFYYADFIIVFRFINKMQIFDVFSFLLKTDRSRHGNWIRNNYAFDAFSKLRIFTICAMLKNLLNFERFVFGKIDQNFDSEFLMEFK